MARTLKFAALAAALMLSASVVGASAFTSAEIDRTATITVKDDTNGVVGLAATDGVGGVKDDGGELTIETGDLNTDSKFTYGSVADQDQFVTGSDTSAFTITDTVSDSQSLTLNINYKMDSESENTADTDDVTFVVYNTDSGTPVEISEEDSPSGKEITIPDGEAVQVLMIINTPDIDQDETVELSGTIEITTTA